MTKKKERLLSNKIDENRIPDKTINAEIRNNLEGLSPYQKDIFKERTDTVWFRAYIRRSAENLKVFTKKIRDGIASGKYVCKNAEPHAPPRGWEGGKIEGQSQKDKVSKKRNKTGKIELRNYNPKTIKRVQSASKKYPDASNYEWRHGVINSKASQNYRARQGQSRKYTGRVIIKEGKKSVR